MAPAGLNWRPALVPSGMLLVSVSRAQDGRLVKRFADKLQRNGEIAGEAAGDGDCGESSKVEWSVILWAEMFVQRIQRVNFFKSGGRPKLARQGEQVYLAENLSAFALDPTADPLRLNVVGRAGQQAQVYSRPPCSGSIPDYSFSVSDVRRIVLVVVDHGVGNRSQLQDRQRNLLDARS